MAVLVNASTVSAGVRFARLLAEMGALTVGTETEGGYDSTNADYTVEIPLGNTGLILNEPLVRVTFIPQSDPRIPRGRGLVPQFMVRQSLEAYLQGTDSQMDYCVQLLSDQP